MPSMKLALKDFSVAILMMFMLYFIPQSLLAAETAVQGLVTDEEGHPINDARLTFEDPHRGLSFHLKTDKNGKFIKVGIPPAVYNVTVEREEYFPLESQAQIHLGSTESLHITLKKIPPQLDKDRDLDEGANFFKDGQFDKAIEAFKKVIEKFPKNYEGYFNLGLAYLKKEDHDQAVTALEKAKEINPNVLSVYFALGECYFAQGESEKALQSFSTAISLAPENSRAYYNLGIISFKLDKIEEALNAFDKAIELAPELSSAYYQAGLSSLKKGDFERAVKYFEDFLRVEPGAPEAAQVQKMLDELKKRRSPSC